MKKLNMILFAYSLILSGLANAGGVTQGYINVSLTILPSGNSCGSINQNKVCSTDIEKLKEDISNSKNNVINKDEYQAIKQGNLITVSY